MNRLILLLLVVVNFSGCKMRGQSDVASLNDGDIEAILGLREKYDENVKKVLIFIESEDRLTDQGDTFFEDFRLLVQNHIGTNYDVYLLASKNPAWVTNKLRQGAFPAKVINNGTYPKTNFAVNDIPYLVQDLQKTYGQKGQRQQKVEVILHFLAHGLSTTGTGEGGVAIGDQKLSFSDIEKKLLSPIAQFSDELIAIIEPCFGGNVAWNLPQDFFLKNNAMIIFGAPPWASQEAISSLSGPKGGFAEGRSDSFTRSPATLAMKRSLMGFASRSDASGDTPVKFAEDKTLNIFAGTEYETVLKEKHVVRVDEFAEYASKRGTMINCAFAHFERRNSVQNMCVTRSFKVHLGPGMDDRGSLVQQKFLSMVSRKDANREIFLKMMRQEFPISPLRVATPIGRDFSLNPKGKNGILSIINILEFERESKSPTESLGSFTGADRDNILTVDQNLQRCLSDIESVNGDLFEAVSWVAKSASPAEEPAKPVDIIYPTDNVPGPDGGQGGAPALVGPGPSPAATNTGTSTFTNTAPKDSRPDFCNKYL